MRQPHDRVSQKNRTRTDGTEYRGVTEAYRAALEGVRQAFQTEAAAHDGWAAASRAADDALRVLITARGRLDDMLSNGVARSLPVKPTPRRRK